MDVQTSILCRADVGDNEWVLPDAGAIRRIDLLSFKHGLHSNVHQGNGE